MEESGFGLKGRVMNRRLVSAVGGSMLLLATLLPTAVVAEERPRFERVDVGSIDPAFIPQIANKNRLERVIVELAAKPVTLRQYDASLRGTKLNRADKAAIRRQLKATQDKMGPQITRLGGKVLAKYQDAYNGIKVQIAAGKLPQLARLAGVVSVKKVPVYEMDNTAGVPYIGAPAAWQDYGFTGTGVKIGIIDTGIDYYHANFGGSGNPADFAADNGLTIGTPAFPNAKVAGGRDFVGNAYDASADPGSPALIPHPDPDPLDCNGHGSHVAGSAAGQGVLAAGTTYTGPYNTSTIGGNTWNVGPGVVPKATLYAYKVFGCDGSTDVVVDAINQAVADGVDVINMSLGSPFGAADTPDAIAANNAALAGVTVVASAGNSGPNAFTTGSPASASRAISVAALDATPTFPGASVDLPVEPDQPGINMNASTDLPKTATLVTLNGPVPGTLNLGCTEADYAGFDVAGKIVAVKRGTCAFVEKGALAQAKGAVGIIVVNRDDVAGLPVFIGSSPEIFDIPMIGVARESQPPIIASNGMTITLRAAGTLTNPGFQRLATFSSGGPRDIDNALKPDVTAPGVSIVSTLSGGGTRGTTLSGTSMASPHTAGVAALVIQAHPTWSPERVKAAIMNTADASGGAAGVLGYNVRTAGSGVVAARRAVDTVTLATTGGGTASLSFGYEPEDGSYSETKRITLSNTSRSSITYNLSNTFNGDALGATISISPSSVRVPARGSRTVDVKLRISKANVAALPSMAAIPTGSVLTIRGVIIATPTVAGTGRYALRVPFLVSPRGLSDVEAGNRSDYSTTAGVSSATVRLKNDGIHSGDADVYAWGISDRNEGLATNDIRAVGVQAFPEGADRFLVFAVNTYGRWGSASDNEFDIGIDTNKDGLEDFYVVAVDGGVVTTGDFNGQMLVFTFDKDFRLVPGSIFGTAAPSNGSTVLLPTLASFLGLTEAAPAFDYNAVGFSIFDAPFDVATGVGHFDPFHPAVSQGDFVTLAPGASTRLGVSVDRARFATTPALGWMVVTLDDANGRRQAELVGVGRLR
jgi:subtilisin family serine protease